MTEHQLTRVIQCPAIHDRTYTTALRLAAWLLILTHGDPDILGAVVGLIGRVL